MYFGLSNGLGAGPSHHNSGGSSTSGSSIQASASMFSATLPLFIICRQTLNPQLRFFLSRVGLQQYWDGGLPEVGTRALGC